MNEPQSTTPRAATGAGPFAPGDLLVLRRPAEPAVFWAVLERHGDRLLLVAADDSPLGLGEHDVEAPVAELGPLVLRCAAGCRVAAGTLADPVRVARVAPGRLRAARAARRRAAACGGRDRLREDRDYRHWLAELREAAAALAASEGRSAPTPADEPRPAGPRPLGPDHPAPTAHPADPSPPRRNRDRHWRAAAALLAASLVMAVGVWQALQSPAPDDLTPIVFQNRRGIMVPSGDERLQAGLPYPLLLRAGPLATHRVGAAGSFTAELLRGGEPAAPPREIAATAPAADADREIVYTLPAGLPPGDYRLILQRGEGDGEEYYRAEFRLWEEPPGD